MQYRALRSLIKVLSVILISNVHINSAIAEELSETGINISFLRETNAGVLVGFTPSPGDCAGSYQGAHAYMSRNAPQFDETVMRLKSAKMLGVQITAHYADIGDCIDEASLLLISNIEAQ